MSNTNYYCYFESPIGRIVIQGNGDFVTGLYLPNHKGWQQPDSSWVQDELPFTEVRVQLTEYFAGERTQFEIPLKLQGTPFQQQVWNELRRIPYGTTLRYGELAQRIGQPNASRAVGNANGRNPISIIVPCHRVIGSDGRLTGYAGGITKKQWLLDWESSGHRNQEDQLELFDLTEGCHMRRY